MNKVKLKSERLDFIKGSHVTIAEDKHGCFRVYVTAPKMESTFSKVYGSENYDKALAEYDRKVNYIRGLTQQKVQAWKNTLRTQVKSELAKERRDKLANIKGSTKKHLLRQKRELLADLKIINKTLAQK